MDDEGALRNANLEIPSGFGAQEFGNGDAGPQLVNDTANRSTAQKPTLSQEAKLGLPGRIVTTVDPYTEADPAAILVNILVMFGNVIGRTAHFIVEESPHYTNEFGTLVGNSSTGRKGLSLSTPKRMFKMIDQTWVTERVTSGLSSGEGLIFTMRDANPSSGDTGEPDKRLLVVEEEFASALKVMKREGNILSPILRQAWDGSPLHPLTKTIPTKCKEPHLSIIGHITPEELRKQLNEIEIANGFANRFMWFYVHRSKRISNPKGVPPEKIQPLITDLQRAVNFARGVQEMQRDSYAEELWGEVYPALTEDRFGLFGVITQRAAPHVLRLSMIYALMDQSSIITKPHLEAALALWDYSEQSVKMIFEDMTGDTNVDLVLKCGRTFKTISRTQMWALIGRNNNRHELDRISKVIEGKKHATLDQQGNLNFK